MFAIHFTLRDPDKIQPFGGEDRRSMCWFALTDGLLWLTVGAHTIYEYTEEAQKECGGARYNDYYVARFAEDFCEVLEKVGEGIPRELYDNAETFGAKVDALMARHEEDTEEAWQVFYDGSFAKLTDWFESRQMDSGYLTAGQNIGFFRCENSMKICWDSEGKTEKDKEFWTSPRGSVEISFEEFVTAVKNFFASFLRTMDEQVEKALAKDWGSVALDKPALAREHTARKERIAYSLALMENPGSQTD